MDLLELLRRAGRGTIFKFRNVDGEYDEAYVVPVERIGHLADNAVEAFARALEGDDDGIDGIEFGKEAFLTCTLVDDDLAVLPRFMEAKGIVGRSDVVIATIFEPEDVYTEEEAASGVLPFGDEGDGDEDEVRDDS